MFDNAHALPAAVMAKTLDAVDSCVAILSGPELRCTFVNRAYQALHPGLAMLGKRFRDIFPEAAQSGTEGALQYVMQTGETCRLQHYPAPTVADPDALWDGEFVRADASGPDGVASVVVFVRNVTQTVQRRTGAGRQRRGAAQDQRPVAGDHRQHHRRRAGDRSRLALYLRQRARGGDAAREARATGRRGRLGVVPRRRGHQVLRGIPPGGRVRPAGPFRRILSAAARHVAGMPLLPGGRRD